jgi:hypothetical protein
MKTEEKRSAKKTRFRPGSTGVCEAQLWTFTGPPKVPSDDHAPDVYRVAAESLDEALRYLRQRYDDLPITEARCVGMGRAPLGLTSGLAVWLGKVTGYSPVCGGPGAAQVQSWRERG